MMIFLLNEIMNDKKNSVINIYCRPLWRGFVISFVSLLIRAFIEVVFCYWFFK
jgi:hypothetical protein